MGRLPEKTPVAQALATLRFLHPPGGVFEIAIYAPKQAVMPQFWEGRAFGKEPMVAGWFKDPSIAAALAVQIPARAVYTTLNPCQPEMMFRANERLKANVDRTRDENITHLRNLLIDIDPQRLSGISSSPKEHDDALTMIQEIKQDLDSQGWPEPLAADSGNGGHLVYPLELEHTPENVELVKTVLAALAWRYDTRLRELGLELDQKVYNPSRISKLYGTVAAKGDNLPERPHRRAQILSLPAERVPVALELLEKIASEAPADKGVQAGKTAPLAGKPATAGTSGPGSRGKMDVAAYLAEYGREVVKVKDHKGSMLYCLQECVFDPSHQGNEAAIGQTAEGALFYQCFHNSCQGRLWMEARQIISGNDKLGKYFPGGQRGGGRGATGQPPPPPPGDAGLPEIVITHRFLQDKSAEGLAALEQGNDPPVIFVRSGALARVLRNEKNSPRIDTLTDMALRGLLCRRALFYKSTKEGLLPASPPMEVPRDIMALGAWSFPTLEGVTAIPIFRPDGSVQLDPGYDPVTQLYYVADPDLEEQTIYVPEEPDAEDVRVAREVVEDIFVDIPFAEPADKANAMAFLCTLPLRPAIEGLIPMAVVTAPTPGTGKSLFADIIALMGTGKVAPMEGLASTDDETRKQITSLLEEDKPLVCFDNVEGELRAPSLARVLTCRVWGDRVLGKNVMVSLPNRTLWMATGNNISLRGDMPRRTFPIRLDAKMSKPWERQGFKYPFLRDLVRHWWPDFLGYIYTLGRAWIVAGKPPPEEPLPVVGGYEPWVETMGGILAFAGVEGFLRNLDSFHAAADQEGQEWEGFLETWWELTKGNACTCQELKGLLNESAEFVTTLPGYLGDAFRDPERNFERTLGKAFSKKENRPYGDQNLAVQRAGVKRKIIRWRVAPLGAEFPGDTGDQARTSGPTESVGLGF